MWLAAGVPLVPEPGPPGQKKIKKREREKEKVRRRKEKKKKKGFSLSAFLLDFIVNFKTIQIKLM